MKTNKNRKTRDIFFTQNTECQIDRWRKFKHIKRRHEIQNEKKRINPNVYKSTKNGRKTDRRREFQLK